MLGKFKLDSLGTFILSGDNSADFMWDLFDQITFGSNTHLSIMGMPIMIASKELGGSLDAQDRIDFRGTKEWARIHCDHFSRRLGNGLSLFEVNIDPDSFYGLHATMLLGALIDHGVNPWDNQRLVHTAVCKFGNDAPEVEAVVSSLSYCDYEYPTVRPIDLVNYMLIKGVLTLQSRSLTDDGSELLSVQSIMNTRLAKVERSAAILAERDLVVKDPELRKKFRRKAK